MNEEKLMILKMVEDGKITADEAAKLLSQVQDDETQRRPQRHPHRQRRPWHDGEPWSPYFSPRPDFGWIDDLRSAIEETTRNSIFTDFMPADEDRFTATQNVGNGIRALMFEGKNAAVKLESYSGDCLEVEAHYKAKSNWDPHITLTEDGGVFGLRYDDNALYSIGIHVRVPETAAIDSVRLKNRNAPITVDDIHAESINLSTKNHTIKLSDVQAGHVSCDTRNATIALDDVEAREIEAQTSNAKISLDDTTAARARLLTSNAKIDIKSSDIDWLHARTSNSSLRFDSFGKIHESHTGANSRGIEAVTTNGQISVRLPQGTCSCRLRASTTMGGIVNELRNLTYRVDESNYIEAQTEGYEDAQQKLELNLQTTHGGIYIRQ